MVHAGGVEVDSVLEPGLCDLFKFDTSSVSYIHEGRTAQTVSDAGDSVFAKAGIADWVWLIDRMKHLADSLADSRNTASGPS